MTDVPDYKWSDDFGDYLRSMLWRHGYEGEKYWREEEDFLLQYFAGKGVSRSLSVGSGLFRELDTLRAITADEVVGIDYEPQFVAYTRKKYASLPAPPAIRIFEGDAQVMQLGQSFDLIVSLFNAIGFIPDMKRALSAMFDHLAVDGHIVISVWMDEASVTQQRMRLYTGSGDKEARIDTKTIPHTISITKEGREVFSSLIFSREFMEALVRSVNQTARITFFDRQYCRLMLVTQR